MEVIQWEWDEYKREANIKKHGIDFVDAIKVFGDSNRIEYESNRNGEKRFQTIGVIEDIVVLIVYTNRDKKKRMISARMTNKKERLAYYQQQ